MDSEAFRRVTFTIGEISVHLKSIGSRGMVLPGEGHPLLRFISEKTPSFTFRVRECRAKNFPSFPIERLIFTNGYTWSLYRDKRKKMLWLDFPYPGGRGDRMAVLDMKSMRGRFYYNSSDKERDLGIISDPLGYPFDQVFMIQLLSRKLGFIVHACGVDYRDEGLLFVGSSGAGKTTIAKLWGEDSATKILSDDRIIVRASGRNFKIYGTPWHGTGKYAKPDSARLKKIFFLKHGKENRLARLTPVEAGTRLLAAAFPPLWDREGMDFTLGLCSKVMSVTPAYELSFLPDADIRGVIKDVR
jgi:hypothetical protein